MPVIVREERLIAGQKRTVKVYKSEPGRLLTREAREQAEKLDSILAEKMGEITREMRKMGLLELKNKKGVLRLWYEAGKRLSFVMDTSIVPAEDRRYVWRAIYDHAGELAPGEPNVRAIQRPENSHFRYCYDLGRLNWEFVERAGNWTAWVEFFDSLVIRNDERIIQWLGEKQEHATGSRQDWVRGLAREIRREFKDIDTGVFSDNELNEKLERILKRVYPESSGSKKV